MDSIGQRIKALRETAHLTQEQLGEKVGVTGVTIMRYEKGLRQPKLKMLANIAMALDAPFSYLIQQEEFISLLSSDLEEKIHSYSSDVASSIEIASERIRLALGELNREGQEKAVERVEELTEIPKYQSIRKACPLPDIPNRPPEAPDGPPEAK